MEVRGEESLQQHQRGGDNAQETWAPRHQVLRGLNDRVMVGKLGVDDNSEHNIKVIRKNDPGMEHVNCSAMLLKLKAIVRRKEFSQDLLDTLATKNSTDNAEVINMEKTSKRLADVARLVRDSTLPGKMGVPVKSVNMVSSIAEQ